MMGLSGSNLLLLLLAMLLFLRRGEKPEMFVQRSKQWVRVCTKLLLLEKIWVVAASISSIVGSSQRFLIRLLVVDEDVSCGREDSSIPP